MLYFKTEHIMVYSHSLFFCLISFPKFNLCPPRRSPEPILVGGQGSCWGAKLSWNNAWNLIKLYSRDRYRDRPDLNKNVFFLAGGDPSISSGSSGSGWGMVEMSGMSTSMWPFSFWVEWRSPAGGSDGIGWDFSLVAWRGGWVSNEGWKLSSSARVART